MSKKEPASQEPVEDIPVEGGEPSAAIAEPAGAELVPVEAEEAIDTGLSAADIEAVRKRARREIEEEAKKRARARLLTAEKKRLREELSLHENTHLDGPLSDMVRITMAIPEFSNTPFIQVNGARYYHGRIYTVPRHVANSLRESMQCMRRHQNEIDGKKRNRELPDGRFQDVFTGATSRGAAALSGVSF